LGENVAASAGDIGHQQARRHAALAATDEAAINA